MPASTVLHHKAVKRTVEGFEGNLEDAGCCDGPKGPYKAFDLTPNEKEGSVWRLLDKKNSYKLWEPQGCQLLLLVLAHQEGCLPRLSSCLLLQEALSTSETCTNVDDVTTPILALSLPFISQTAAQTLNVQSQMMSRESPHQSQASAGFSSCVTRHFCNIAAGHACP